MFENNLGQNGSGFDVNPGLGVINLSDLQKDISLLGKSNQPRMSSSSNVSDIINTGVFGGENIINATQIQLVKFASNNGDRVKSVDLVKKSASSNFGVASNIDSLTGMVINGAKSGIVNYAPTSLQFNTSKTTYNVGETVSLTNAWVYDSNGAGDLSKVDFWLQKDGGNWQDISDVFSFTPYSSDNRWGSFNYSLSNLGTGSYQLWATAYDKSGASSSSVQQGFSVLQPNVAPTSLQFNTSKTTYNVGETVSLTNAWVYDSNGAGDLSKVDFWLQKDGGNWQDISDVFSFTPYSSDNTWGGFNYSLSNLGTGSYQLWATAYDKSGASSSSVQQGFSVLQPNVPPTITIVANDNNAGEVLTGQTQNSGQFTLTRTGNLTSALTVNYAVSGTATNGTDYSNLSGNITFAAGSSTALINLNVIDDSIYEGSENVVLTLINNANYTVGTSNNSATVTIADNDVVPTITIVANDNNAGEVLTGQTQNSGQFTLTRTGNLTSALTVNYAVSGTATNGTDYSNLSGNITFAAGSSTALINVNVIDDSIYEGSENVVLTLINNANYTVGTSNNSATVNIADNDVVPTITIVANDNNAGEVLTGQTQNSGQFTLTRTGNLTSVLTVNYAVSGTATNGTDYSNLSGNITFAAGSSTALINVNVIDDSIYEGSENVVLTLINNANYTVGTSNNSATVNIADNDVVPTITIVANDNNAGEVLTGQTQNSGQFTLTRTGNLTSALTVNYTVSGTATNGTDYSNLSGNITFAAGSSTALINLNVIDDSIYEGSENVVLTLINNANYTVGTSNNSATVTIADNDLAPTTDWYSQNLRDAQLINLTRSLAADGNLSRNDMISIFRDAKDGNIIDGNELTDLRTIISNSSRFTMTDNVIVLSNKIANGNVANQFYQGGSLGNLYAGSSTTQMENLINKWFLGGDRPSAPSGYSFTYQQASGSLFGNDGTFSYQDISQGFLGDCYFLASLGATALQRPSAIQNMFIDNADGTYTVRLFGENNGNVTTSADYVTVDKWLPTNVAGDGETEQRFADYDNANIGLWVALAEKAYAQFAEAGVTQRDSTTNSYGSIEGGWGFRAMPTISGINGGYYANSSWSNTGPRKGAFLSLADISSQLSSGRALTADTISSPSLGIVGGHEYMIIGANTSNGTITLYNPWGTTITGETNGTRVISYNDFKNNFEIINVV